LCADTWKVRHLAIVVQHSGAHRSVGQSITGMLTRIVGDKPDEAQITVVGFDARFEQLEGARFRRQPVVFIRSAELDQILETITGLRYHGPSPVYDAVVEALEKQKPDLVLLISNGVDNASETEFDDLVKRAEAAKIPVVSLYFPAQPPAGGDNRLKKLAKASGGRFIDIRQKDSWDQLQAALR
jgi:hypothetical protein